VMTLAAVLLGAALGWLLILRSRRRGVQQGDHPPSINGDSKWGQSPIVPR
jgi:hypothetical protein